MKKIIGKTPSQVTFEEAAQTTYAECRPISDVRCCADFRRQIVRTLTVRALSEAFERTGGV
jgi:CO/xanthine dehydrogenase FAD-binding subunit